MIYLLGALCLVFLVLYLLAEQRVKNLRTTASTAEQAHHEKALPLKSIEAKLQSTTEAHQELRLHYDALQQKADEANMSLAAVKTERTTLAEQLKQLQA